MPPNAATELRVMVSVPERSSMGRNEDANMERHNLDSTYDVEPVHRTGTAPGSS
jgi:hypothetical protein